MSKPVLELNEDVLLRDPLHSPSELHSASNSKANQQSDLVDTFGLFKDYLDKKLVDLKSDILSEQENLSKKYRDEANIKFKSEGNRIQFRFNESILDGLNKIHKDLKEINSSGLLTTPLGDGLLLKNTSVMISPTMMKTRKRFVRQKLGPLKLSRRKKNRLQPYTASPTPTVEPIATASAPPAYDFSRYQQPFRTSTARREPCSMDICHY
ncbi:Hypothetical predicted protein [Mytilus galloprovincialis]|uniref:Uncharacterized protein n=1 Tax=Mytilus galloprovincialis TaxID=29158 RepID=A0A8B6CPV5_MYTGA|nr:Hypothetical predicted protein [Mytilus galloprovincialis]